MKKLLHITFLIAGISILGFVVHAQNVEDLRINEVMLFNSDNYVDNFGQRSAWIEIMNTGYNSVNMENCYLTNDLNDLKKYRIPSGDPISIIPTRQFVVFLADMKTEHGTLHLNFTLDSIHRFIALVSSNGKTILDSVTVPLLGPNQVYARTTDGGPIWCTSQYTTPNSTNEGQIEKTSASEEFGAFDPSGLIMTIIAMSVVFISLIFLYRIFHAIGNANQRASRRKKAKEMAGQPIPQEDEVAGEVFAAISTALYLYESDKHDYESAIITIERVSKRYSPWSSKIYGLREMPPRIIQHQPKR